MFSPIFVMVGTVKVWDVRQKDTPVANMEPTEGETKRDCWTVAFGVYLYLSTSITLNPDREKIRNGHIL